MKARFNRPFTHTRAATILLAFGVSVFVFQGEGESRGILSNLGSRVEKYVGILVEEASFHCRKRSFRTNVVSNFFKKFFKLFAMHDAVLKFCLSVFREDYFILNIIDSRIFFLL